MSEGSDTILEPGMLITKEGNESLTRYPVDLASIWVRAAKPLKHLVGAITRRVAGLM